MSQDRVMYDNSSIFDFTFLNPFYKANNSYLGKRFGLAQFILFTCLIIGTISVSITFKDIKPILAFVTFWIIQYYGISCLLIPDNHTRCYLWTWIFNILPVIIVTLISVVALFGLKNKIAGLVNMGGGSMEKKKKKKKKN